VVPRYDHWVSGAYCFASFMVFGSVPLLGYVIFLSALGNDPDALFGISCGLTAITLFALGALKSRFTIRTWWASGLEILLMGALTAAAAYLIGWGVEAILAGLGVTR
jgi:VIT1/CCC1 family predicted Fe2+/Mn2+ transporter